MVLPQTDAGEPERCPWSNKRNAQREAGGRGAYPLPGEVPRCRRPSAFLPQPDTTSASGADVTSSERLNLQMIMSRSQAWPL